MVKGKRAVAEVGVAIIVMGLLLFLGSIFFDSDFSVKENYKKQKSGGSGDDLYPYNTYLFYLNDTDIGRQQRVTESFPNIELGSKEVTNMIHLGSSFRLVANPFTANSYYVDLSFTNPGDVDFILIYFDPKRLWGDNHINFYVDGEWVTSSLARGFDIPIKIPVRITDTQNFTKMRLSMEIEKPKWYALFNWNKVDFVDFQVAELTQNKENNKREFNFQIPNERFLERVYLNLAVECVEAKEVSEAIKVTVNDFVISNENPQCISRYNTIEANVPINILEETNTIELETTGFYKIGYSVNKVYFNDQQVYKFTVNSFNDIVDVVLYGDFDRREIDIRLNGQTFDLERDEIKSIIPYLRFGVNEIKILTKPVEIDELIIEKNEFLY